MNSVLRFINLSGLRINYTSDENAFLTQLYYFIFITHFTEALDETFENSQ